METANLFNILDKVDSTNNYAMQRVHAGLAKNGEAWFTYDQFAGKGQRGKNWESSAGKNIAMSIVLTPRQGFSACPFVFNALVANTCRAFLASKLGEEVMIKWPNDIYYGDRKAGGLLIENIYQGKDWRWAVIGIGINVNQPAFPTELKNPVSMYQISQIEYDVVELAKELHQKMVNALLADGIASPDQVMQTYNEHLFGKNRSIKLRRQNINFESKIISVDKLGFLHTEDSIPRQFSFGEVEWIL